MSEFKSYKKMPHIVIQKKSSKTIMKTIIKLHTHHVGKNIQMCKPNIDQDMENRTSSNGGRGV